jgi:HlyB family type I secretion system ABC transporter
MSVSEAPIDIPEALRLLPALSLLAEDVRRVVAASFEPRSYRFGEVIVAEGDQADAFYLLVSGAARVVKRTDGGDEVSLNVLRGGDCFGEMALLSDARREATVRASGPVDVLRLDRSVFLAITRLYPDARAAFEALARQRALGAFLRIHSSFSELPKEALILLASQLEPVAVAAGMLVIREGEPAGPMYVVKEGRLRVFRSGEATAKEDVGYVRAGDFFGERSLFLDEPRDASVEALTDCVLFRFGPDLFRRLMGDYPAFRTRLQQRIAQYDYRRLARVPLDFAEEILPADASVVEKVGPEQAEPLPAQERAFAGAAELEAGSGPIRARRIRRFPHIYQLDEMDCGAACLAMVCRHFGRNVSISLVRDVVHTATDGTSLAGITRGAEELGLAARSVRASKSRLDELPLPAIVHWDGNHWVVLYSVNATYVEVSDPARATHRVPREAFLATWSGYASLLSTTPGFKDLPAARPGLQWLMPFVRPHLGQIVVAFLMACLAAGLQLVLPILTQVVVDQVLPRRDLDLLYVVIVGIAAVLLTMAAATVVQRYLLSRVAVLFDIATIDFVTARLLELPMRYFNTRRTGDIERRLRGVQDIRQLLVQGGVQALTSATQLLAALLLMIVYSWTLALVYLATVPLYLLLMRFSATRLRPLYDSLEDAYGRYQSAQIDAIRGIETVKALAAEEAFRRAMMGHFRSLADRVFRSEFLVMAYQGGVQLLTVGSFGLFLFVGAFQVIQGDLSLGRFVSFNALIALANAPVLGLLALWDEFQLAQILVGRLDDVLDQEPEQGADHSALRSVTTLAGRVELRGLGFRYGGAESPAILEGIDLVVEPGESVAIVGRSGSGKSTLMKLLAGLMEPTDGSIVYDGLELGTLDYRTLRRRVGFVLQETYLFDATIAENIAFGEAEPDMRGVTWAARAANAHEFVQRLPLGYATRVGERGLRLSGGQQQRLAIARALYRRPPILLFDEATSALDSESERAVKESLDELLADRTSFVIAHRLSTVRDADRIVVLDRGRLVEQGSHDELMARQGLYFYLASQQLEL